MCSLVLLEKIALQPAKLNKFEVGWGGLATPLNTRYNVLNQRGFYFLKIKLPAPLCL